MSSRLYIAFWDLCLDNLPEGRFERRAISVADAQATICCARANRTLRCASRHDLLAPHGSRERRRHEELCGVLRESCNIPLTFEDFLIGWDDDRGAVQSILPLELVRCAPGDRLLVITCDYVSFGDRSEAWSGLLSERFAVAPDSVGFHLITPLPVLAAAMA
jgi:hypothetical protein